MDGAISEFGKYGLSGLVIFALFALILLLIKELKAMNESTDKRIDEQSNRHNAERQQWLSQLKEFAEVLRSFSSKRCGATKPSA